MAWLLHTRCISFVDHLSLPKLYLLLDLVSLNVMSNAQLNPPRSQHDAFYAELIQEENSMPEPPVYSVKQLAQGFWGVACTLFCYIALAKEQTDGPSSLLLPADIWDLVLQYDIGRLLFIMRTASQLSKIDIQHRIPNTRFSIEILDLPSSVVQIHLISIGGRTYISHLSNSTGNHGTQAKDIRSCDISGSNYIAVKSDRIGIVDIAFEAQAWSTRLDLAQSYRALWCRTMSDQRCKSSKFAYFLRCMLYFHHPRLGHCITVNIGSQMPGYCPV